MGVPSIKSGRAVLALAALSLVVAGCSSGSGSGNPTPDPASSTSAAPSADRSGAETSPEDPLGFGDKDATAVVVIAGQRYEFADLYCVNIGGAMGAASIGSGPSVDINVPPENWETDSLQDWDPPSILLKQDDPPLDFRAGGDVLDILANVQPGTSQVDSFTTDGYRASGTATFIDITDFTAEFVPVTGTFEVSCPRP